MTQDQVTMLLNYLYNINVGIIILVGIASFRFVSALLRGDLR